MRRSRSTAIPSNVVQREVTVRDTLRFTMEEAVQNPKEIFGKIMECMTEGKRVVEIMVVVESRQAAVRGLNA